MRLPVKKVLKVSQKSTGSKPNPPGIFNNFSKLSTINITITNVVLKRSDMNPYMRIVI